MVCSASQLTTLLVCLGSVLGDTKLLTPGTTAATAPAATAKAGFGDPQPSASEVQVRLKLALEGGKQGRDYGHHGHG